MTQKILPNESPLSPKNLAILTDPYFKELVLHWYELDSLHRANLLKRLFSKPHSIRRVAKLLIPSENFRSGKRLRRRGDPAKSIDEGTIRNYLELASLEPRYHRLLGRGTPIRTILKMAREDQARKDQDLWRELNLEEDNLTDRLFGWLLVWVREYGPAYRSAALILAEASVQARRLSDRYLAGIRASSLSGRQLMAHTRPTNLDDFSSDLGRCLEMQVNWIGAWAIRMCPRRDVLVAAFDKAAKYFETAFPPLNESSVYDPYWLDRCVSEDVRRQRDYLLYLRAHSPEIFRKPAVSN